MTMDISELPTEVIMNIQSHLLGRPEDLKIKRNKKFYELQRLFKINYSYRLNQVLFTKVKSSYYIMGLKLKPSILLKQKDRLVNMRDETYETFKNKFTISQSYYNSYIQILSFGDDYELLFDEVFYGINFLGFLQKAKMEIEHNIRYYNCKLDYINISVCFKIDED